MDTLVERVTNKIAETIHPDKIILFGSRAKGTATEESDLDLVVVYSRPKSKRQIEVEIDSLFMPRDFSMDVIVTDPEYLEKFKHIANTLAREVAEDAASLSPKFKISSGGSNGFGTEKLVFVVDERTPEPGLKKFITVERAVAEVTAQKLKLN